MKYEKNKGTNTVEAHTATAVDYGHLTMSNEENLNHTATQTTSKSRHVYWQKLTLLVNV